MLEKSQLLMIDFFDDYTIEGIVDNGSYENVCKIVIDQDNKITDYSCNCYGVMNSRLAVILGLFC